MVLIFIYGAPAVGKYSVAKKLSALTKYPLLHNHLTANLASDIFPFGTKEYATLAAHLREVLIQNAIQKKIPGIIMTFAYGLETYKGRGDDAHLQKLFSLVIRNGGIVLPVQLTCTHSALRRRIATAQREKLGKLTSWTQYLRIERSMALYRMIPGEDSLTLETTHTSPKVTAIKVLKELKARLKKVKTARYQN